MIRSLVLAAMLLSAGFYAGRHYDTVAQDLGPQAGVGQILIGILQGPDHAETFHASR
jgi:hypothetical protein